MITILVVQNWLLHPQLLRYSWKGTFFCTWNYWIWNACVPYNFSTNRTHTVRPTATPPGNSSSVLHGFLWLHDKMRQILTHPSVPTVHRRLEWNWQDGRKFWQTVKNTKTTGNSIQHIFKSLQHFQRSASRKVCFSLQKKSSFHTMCNEWTVYIWDLNSNLVNNCS